MTMRCDQCQHWGGEERSGFGHCDAVTDSEQAYKPANLDYRDEVRAVVEATYCDSTAALKTRPNFGCVLFEPKP